MLKTLGRTASGYLIENVKIKCKGGNCMNDMNSRNDMKCTNDTGSGSPVRRAYLDNIRFITVCIVVIYHVIYMFNGVQPFGVIGAFKERQLQDAFQYITYPWFMALLFVVSGMSSRYYLEGHSTKRFFKDRTRKLLVPSTLGLFAFHWILGYYNMIIGGGFEEAMSQMPKPMLYVIMAVSGTGVLWFIQVLWLLSLLLILIRKIEKDRLYNLCKRIPIWLILLFCVVNYLAAQVLNTPMITVYRFGIYGFCFLMGYFVFSHDEIVDRLCSLRIIHAVVAVGLGISYTILYFGENYATEPVINNMLACLFCWFAILAILTNMKKYFDYSTAFTSWMSRKSWSLYIFHYLPLAMVAYYLHIYAPGLPAFVVYLLVVIAAFAGAFVLGEVVSRIPVIRYCVLGIKGKKNV